MATPFSPFVGRIARPAIKRRQSEMPSDLIDWDAPTMPEIEKERIVYEDYIKELVESHEIDQLLNEQIYTVAHETIVANYQKKLKDLEKERSTVDLLLGQVKMFEDEVAKERSTVNQLLEQVKVLDSDVKASSIRVEELEAELSASRSKHEEDKENWLAERSGLKEEIENLNFKVTETMCELNDNLESFIQKKNEAEEYKKKMEGVKNQLNHYKRLAKGKAAKLDDE